MKKIILFDYYGFGNTVLPEPLKEFYHLQEMNYSANNLIIMVTLFLECGFNIQVINQSDGNKILYYTNEKNFKQR
jgi:hypothetical protein